MRPLEILLWLAELLAFAALAAARRDRRWGLGLALAALLAAGVQVLAEGARWQMVPAYALSGGLVLWALLRPRRAAYVGAALGVLALLLAAALPLAVPVFRLPPPGGPYGVGARTYHWVDAARPELFTADPADRRELMVQVWYPAATTASQPRTAYVRDGAALAPLARLMHLPGFVFGHLKYVRTHAVASAPAARGAFPVLVFSHGRGGYRQHNTAQVENLVSHGYVVATIDHPYAAAGVAFPDGRRAAMDPRMLDRRFIDRIIPFLAQDVGFTLDRLADLDRADPVLAGHLDLRRAGAFGVSLGGAVAAQACLRDPRLGACLAMDVFMPAEVVRAGLRQPAMWISRDPATMRREGWSRADVEETPATDRAVFETLPGDGYIVLIPGAYHPTFSDAPLMVARPLARPLGLVGTADPDRVREIFEAVSLAFFDRHLKGAPAPLLDDPAKTYPEVIFEARRRAGALAR